MNRRGGECGEAGVRGSAGERGSPAKDYLLFLADLLSLGNPYLAMSAFALSTFLIIKGDLLTSSKVGTTVIPGKYFPVDVLDI